MFWDSHLFVFSFFFFVLISTHLNPGKLIPFRASILAYPFPNRSTHPAPRIGIHWATPPIKTLKYQEENQRQTVRIKCQDLGAYFFVCFFKPCWSTHVRFRFLNATEHKNNHSLKTFKAMRIFKWDTLHQSSEFTFFPHIWQQRCYTYITTLDLGLLILSQVRSSMLKTVYITKYSTWLC